MDKMRFESPDMTAQNIDRIAALFPNCITEMLDEEDSTPEKKVYKRAVNFELLKQMLSPDVVDGDEAYEFTWVGKKAAIVEAKASSVPKNGGSINEYKVIIPRSGNPGGSILGKPKMSEPNTCSSNTYVVAIPPQGKMTVDQAENLIIYLKTKFVRYLIATKTSTQDMPPKAYEFVPIQDFDEVWNDQALYIKYSLTEKEIAVIEETIPAME